jgi:hypothetical protein
MPANWKLVQAFIREATEDNSFQPVADISIAYAKLRTLQQGHFQTATSGNGTTQISSTIGDTAFAFAVQDSLDVASIIEIAETALQLIDGKTVAGARALLKRRKTTRPDFSCYRP